MSNTLEQIRLNISSLMGASVERNGKYMYICKDGKCTNIKAPINNETESIQSAVALFSYILRNSLA